MEKKQTYTVKIACKNCGFGRFPAYIGIEVPRGKEADDYLRTYDCPQCGCLSIVNLS